MDRYNPGPLRIAIEFITGDAGPSADVDRAVMYLEQKKQEITKLTAEHQCEDFDYWADELEMVIHAILNLKDAKKSIDKSVALLEGAVKHASE